MKRRHSILLTLVALLVVVPLVLMMWPEGPLDLSKDEEPFRSMVLPPKSATGDIYMDGGSVGTELIDGVGKKYEITFPIKGSKTANRHPTACWGNIDDPKMITLKNPDRAKTIMIRLLKDHRDRNDEGAPHAIYALSESLGDAAQLLFEKMLK